MEIQTKNKPKQWKIYNCYKVEIVNLLESILANQLR